ncbi:Hsp20/alpha crystallin family protein [bacterium]|nr:Hsp20/alpha crystallin family protein [bacterium]MBU1989640.1 Hsp20/alpha crystallin family protein [bacterium]
MKNVFVSSAAAVLLVALPLQAFEMFDIDINKRIDRNKALIQQYKEAVSKLEKENKYMLDQKAKHPELYVKKPLFENLKDKYIYRIKLNGAKSEALNFMIKDNIVTLSMNMKREEKNDYGYFYNSQYFSSSYAIAEDVQQEKITHKIEGDYFTIEMPKK